MSAQGTAAAKKSITKGEQMAREMAEQLGGVAVRSGSGGMTLMTKAEAERRKLIDAKRAKLDAQEQPALTPKSLALFLAYWDDAGNWSGTPLVGGNVGGSKQERGNLTQLKQAGLIETFESDGQLWVRFTAAGETFAASQKQPAPVVEQPKASKKAAKKLTLTIVPAAPAGVRAGEKFCKRHNTTHPLDAFANDRSAPSGKYSICRTAEAEDRAAKKARLAAAATPAPIAAAAMPQTVKKAKKVSRKK